MELIAPAGNLEKLKAAVRFGADAVYCGAGSYSLRAPETSFSIADLAEGVQFAHDHQCKVYLAMNIFAFDEDIAGMLVYFDQAACLGIDAVIVSDPGIIAQVRRRSNAIRIHLSTQANTTNSESARFWREQGVDRIVAARELSLARIGEIRKRVPDMELEVFVHGAMCIAYSGRCLLSKFMSDRSANRGLCAQPCRWEYQLEESVSGEKQTIEQDLHGTYILNSRDLCMIGHIPELAAAGVDSLKIEGRMKTAYYTAMVTRVYRAALDSYLKSPENYRFDPRWLEELKSVSHRPYTTGFYLPDREDETECITDSSPIRGYDFVGTADLHDRQANILTIRARNRFAVGDILEIIDPDHHEVLTIKVGEITDTQSGKSMAEAHNSYVVDVSLGGSCDHLIGKDAMIRRVGVYL